MKRFAVIILTAFVTISASTAFACETPSAPPNTPETKKRLSTEEGAGGSDPKRPKPNQTQPFKYMKNYHHQQNVQLKTATPAYE